LHDEGVADLIGEGISDTKADIIKASAAAAMVECRVFILFSFDKYFDYL
jgi:hypothetical protein